MSSISPLHTKDFASRLRDVAAEFLDAPVSGGEPAAKSGTLTIMVGGPEAIYERAKPILELMGKTITLIGDNGAGQTAKVANQIVVALTIEPLAKRSFSRRRLALIQQRCGKLCLGDLHLRKSWTYTPPRAISFDFAVHRPTWRTAKSRRR